MFHPKCRDYGQILVIIFTFSFNVFRIMVMSLLSLLIFVLYIFCSVNLARGLSTLLIFSKNLLLVPLIFFSLMLFFFLQFNLFLFIISFLLLSLV